MAIPRRILVAWLPFLFMLVLIAFGSGSFLHSGRTGSWLGTVIEALYRPITPRALEIANMIFRKAVHVATYALLCALALRGWRETLRESRPWTMRVAALSIVTAALVASMDEFHQSFYPERGASLGDVVLDTIAAILAQFLLAAAFAWTVTSASRAEQK